MTALVVEHASFTYRTRQGTLRALDDVSFAVGEGQAVALLGPNGSGKSTLFRLLCGLLPREPSTRVAIFGSGDPAAARRRLGVVFQRPALDPLLGVQENLRLQARLYGLRAEDARRRIDEGLRRAGLDGRRDDRVKTLSGGLARRLDLARALLHGPKLLLLDEPTVGLDPAARASFLDELEQRRRDDGLTIVMSTHLVDEADRAERVILLDRGRIVADAPPAALRAALGARQVTVHDPAWQPPAGTEAWERRAGGWRRALPEHADGTASLATDLSAAGVPFTIAPPTLADVFEHMTGTELSAKDGTQ